MNREQAEFAEAMSQRFIAEHPQLNNPAGVAALRMYFSELPVLPWHTSAYCDELRARRARIASNI
jgi:hypothetical protein